MLPRLLLALLALCAAARGGRDAPAAPARGANASAAAAAAPPLADGAAPLPLCECERAEGAPFGLSCAKEGWFVAGFERAGSWVAGGGHVPLSHALCCRPCLPAALPPDPTGRLPPEALAPAAIVSLGCHAAAGGAPGGVRCEAAGAGGLVAGFVRSVHVLGAGDTYYPAGEPQCCTPAVLTASGDAWRLERCGCEPPDVFAPGGGGAEPGGAEPGGGGGGPSSPAVSAPGWPGAGALAESVSCAAGSNRLLAGFESFRVSPAGEAVPVGPPRCCGVCLAPAPTPAAEGCEGLARCSGRGVCALGRCECFDGWAGADCSRRDGGRGRGGGGGGGDTPPWAVALSVLAGVAAAGILFLGAVVLGQAIAGDGDSPLLANLLRGGRGGGAAGGAGEPLLLRIEGDDGGSVGSQDTDGSEDGDAEGDGVEQRIAAALERTRAAAEGAAQAAGGEAAAETEHAPAAAPDEEAAPADASTAAAAAAAAAAPEELGEAPAPAPAPPAAPAAPAAAEPSASGAGAGGDEKDKGSAWGPSDGPGMLSPYACTVCMVRPLQTALVPCGHVCMCRRCARRLDRCPVCRREIARRQRLFV